LGEGPNAVLDGTRSRNPCVPRRRRARS